MSLLVTWALFLPNALAYSFFSTHEAHLITDNTLLCMGDCYEKYGQLKCTTTWSGSESTCETTSTPTRRYRTYTNAECVSNCDYYGEDYQWCATSNSDWGKCSRNIALVAKRTRETNDIYKTCSGECAKQGSSSPWCYVVGDSWQRCDPDAITHTFNYPTLGGSVCATRCKIYGSNPKCYTVAGKWDTCFLNPSYIDELNVIDTNLHRHCPFGEYEHSGSGGYRLCKRHRHARASDDETENELFFNCDADVDVIALSHRSNNPTVVLRHADPNNMITADRNPILSYTLLPTISYFNDVTTPIDLPLVVSALLTDNTLAPSRTRDAFTSRVDANYDGMDRNLRHLNYDERGHILASRLGGPMETFNIFPQPWRMNRGRNSMWYGLEVELDRFLRGHAHRYVLFTAVLSYATDNSHVLEHRPTAVMLRVRAFNNSVMVHLDGTPVTATRPNTLENMYFSNDPNHSCEPLPAVTQRPRG